MWRNNIRLQTIASHFKAKINLSGTQAIFISNEANTIYITKLSPQKNCREIITLSFN
jgi:hypothetical protein